MYRRLCLLLIVACSTNAPAPPKATPGSAHPVPATPPHVSADAAAPEPRVPPTPETTCSVDADCALTSDELVDAEPRTYACCAGCTDHAVTAVWRAKFRQWCEVNPAPMCPPIGCAMPIMRAVCVAGQCAAKPAR